VLSVVLMAACESPTEPTGFQDQRVLVHAVLDLSTTLQAVVLEHTEPAPFVGHTIPGATVTIHTPFSETPGVEDSISATNSTVYRVPLGPSPGDTYELRIITPQGDTITGTTTTPTALPVTGAQTFIPPFNRNTDTLRLQWPRVAGAAGYQVHVYTEETGNVPLRLNYTAFTDTAIVIAGNAENIENGFFAFPRNRRVRVVVAAVDDNYLTYYRAPTGPFSGAPPSRLTGGAIGVFGSIVPILIRRYDVE
jgi:hypothetical protein